jgi:hypothetical protein
LEGLQTSNKRKERLTLKPEKIKEVAQEKMRV